MSAKVAAAAAGITYRQLDHWARRGWVEPSEIEEIAPGRRMRWYRPLDVARLATLRHLARCGFDLAALGAEVGQLELRPGTVVVAGGDPERLLLVPTDRVPAAVGGVGRWSVFDPAALLTAHLDVRDEVPARRSA